MNDQIPEVANTFGATVNVDCELTTVLLAPSGHHRPVTEPFSIEQNVCSSCVWPDCLIAVFVHQSTGDNLLQFN